MSETDAAHVSGRCRCGAWRFSATAEPLQVSYCHCADCRKATGAPVTVFAGFRHADVETSGGAPAEYSAVPGVSRLFCGHCGTPIGYRDDRLPGEIHFYLGVIDEASRLVPQMHAFAAERLEWLEIDDGLPRHAAFSRPR